MLVTLNILECIQTCMYYGNFKKILKFLKTLEDICKAYLNLALVLHKKVKYLHILLVALDISECIQTWDILEMKNAIEG